MLVLDVPSPFVLLGAISMPPLALTALGFIIFSLYVGTAKADTAKAKKFRTLAAIAAGAFLVVLVATVGIGIMDSNQRREQREAIYAERRVHELEEQKAREAQEKPAATQGDQTTQGAQPSSDAQAASPKNTGT